MPESNSITNHAKIEIPEYVTSLMKQLERNGKECYVVGGAIRSLLLKLPVHDYDLTTNALPDEMEQIFAGYRTIKTGIKHGTLTVLSDRHPIEITTYRKDGTYKDHRRPDEVIFTKAIREDCARRDFTVNAFCYNEKNGLLDFFNGQADLKNHIIRCIGDPDKRFEEDALRILRAIRFAAQLNFTIEPNTSQALRKKKDELIYVSMERIHEEMTGFLKCRTCADLLDIYREVIGVFIPEILNIDSDSWNRTLEAMRRCIDDDDLRMAVLLSNPAISDPHRILNRLKYANANSRKIQALIQFQNTDVSSRIALRHLLNQLPCDFEDYLQYRRALSKDFQYIYVNELYQNIINDGDCYSLKQLKITGNDLIQAGYQGKAISDELHHVLNLVMDDQLPNRRNELLSQIRKDYEMPTDF